MSTPPANSGAPWSRRDALRLGAAASLGAAWLGGCGRSLRGGMPRNIIFMVSDGMSLGVPSLAEPFARLARGRGTHWVALTGRKDAARGFFDMASLDSLVTDSAAAATSWGAGARVFNGAINRLPDGGELTPVCAVARDRGKRTGLVTTTRATHATPAGFAASVKHRDLEDGIAGQYLGRVDVVMGGGLRHFRPGAREDRRDLLAAFDRAGYRVVQDRAGLMGVTRAPVLGLFADDHLPFTLDQMQSEALLRGVPSLEEMTRAALSLLAGHPGGFLLQIEGGRVDHAAHANDAAAILRDQLAFDDAIGAVLEFVKEHPDTLVVVTTDHGNSNPGLNGMGPAYTRSTPAFETTLKASASTQVLMKKCMALPEKARPADLAAIIAPALGFEIKPAEAAALLDVLRLKEPAEINMQHRNFPGLLGQIAGNHNGINWCGVSHTADWAPILAVGPGSERFAGFLANTDAFGHLADLMGSPFRNRSMTPEDAARFRQKADAERSADKGG